MSLRERVRLLRKELCDEVIVELDRLEAEIASLRAQNELTHTSYVEENNRLMAEREALREALSTAKRELNDAEEARNDAETRLLASLTTAPQDAEALDRYRYAVAFAAADSWDGGPDMRYRLEWARANDPGGHLTNDRVAEIGGAFPAEYRGQLVGQDAEEIARLKEECERRFDGRANLLEVQLRLANELAERYSGAASQDAQTIRDYIAWVKSLQYELLQDAEEIARLREALRLANELVERYSSAASRATAAEARDRRAAKEKARLTAALKPFAQLAEAIECTSDHTYDDGEHWEIEIGALRQARAALACRTARNRPLPETRCDCCDNGLDDAWEFCPFCGQQHPDPAGALACRPQEKNNG